MDAGLHLIAASADAIPDLEAFLKEVGPGENGFWGSDFGTEESSLEDYLQSCEAMSRGQDLAPDRVPQTTFWLLDGAGAICGMSRLRHRINDALLIHGGHIGYYVRASERGKGFGTAILRLMLVEAKELGIERALLTVDSDNEPSIRVIETNGGVMEDERVDRETGLPYRRYWIDVT